MRVSFKFLSGAVLAFCACSEYTGPDDGGNTPPPPPAATASVDVQDNQFVASSVQVLQGGSVHWTWRGSNLHNVTFTGGPASESRTNGTFDRTFETAGTFSYICTVHGASMSGRVTVVSPTP